MTQSASFTDGMAPQRPRLSSLRTLDTARVARALPSLNTSGDFFVLQLFRAVASHVLTTGRNLRAEPSLVISGRTAAQLPSRLLALRDHLGLLPTAGPIPVVLTRCGHGIDFSAPFFTDSAAGPVVLVQSGADALRDKLAQAGARASIVPVGPCMTPTQAVSYCFQTLGATRVSVEAGPSVASELYKAGTIDAAALSVLEARAAEVWDDIPVLDRDPLFDNLDGAASILHTEYSLAPNDQIASLVPSLEEWQVGLNDAGGEGGGESSVSCGAKLTWSWTWWTRKTR